MSSLNSETFKLCFAIAALTAIEIVALSKKINGTILRLVIITIAGLAGFGIAELLRLH